MNFFASNFFANYFFYRRLFLPTNILTNSFLQTRTLVFSNLNIPLVYLFVLKFD